MGRNEAMDDWDAVCALQDDDIPLLHASLLIARDEYPELDIACYESMCDDFERALRPRTDAIDGAPLRLAAINRYLYEDLGFSGNQQDYYDPRNSYLNDVLERKLGIPISLGEEGRQAVAQRQGSAIEGLLGRLQSVAPSRGSL
jgi:regulator of sirC expression with transglutaminase-like and TPR domain